MDAFARSRFQRGSPRKMNRIAELIRDKDVPTALATLSLLAKPSKQPLFKTLRSAVANAINKSGKARIQERDLVVKEVRVDPGPNAMKRLIPGPRGTASVFVRKMCHIYVKVGTREEKV
ncbi:MAG: large ribosomal subunit protein uL22 [bacterium]